METYHIHNRDSDSFAECCAFEQFFVLLLFEHVSKVHKHSLFLRDFPPILSKQINLDHGVDSIKYFTDLLFDDQDVFEVNHVFVWVVGTQVSS
jgi:hypothetical protein